MIASVGCSIRGSARFSTRTSPGACMTTPRMVVNLLPYGKGWSVLVGLLVLLVGDGLEPGGGVAAVGLGLEQRQVAHERVGGGAVPVVLVRRADDGLAGVDAQHLPVAGADETDALGDVQGLPDGVGVPVGAGAGGEPDEGDGHARRAGAAEDRRHVH